MGSLMTQNGSVLGKYGSKELEEGVKVLARKPCRDKAKNNWVCRVRGPIFADLMRAGSVGIDFIRCPVREYIDVVQCLRCCGFGHVAKSCREGRKCGACSGDHETRDCKTSQGEFKCINCTRAGIHLGAHKAMDKECPVYKRKVEMWVSRIDYGD